LNILYLAHRLPYFPDKGEKIRAFHTIRQLAVRHSVYVVSFIEELAEISHVAALRKHCASVEVVLRGTTCAGLLHAAVEFLGRRPLSVSLFYRKTFADKVLSELRKRKIDCIIATSGCMGQYASNIRVAKIIDFIDVDSEKWRMYSELHAFPWSVIYRLEGRRLAQHEQQLAETFDYSILVSTEETRLLQQRTGGCRITAISNGVDLEYFRPSNDRCTEMSQPVIIFTGVMDYFPNVDAVRFFSLNIFPLVRRIIPDARFYIVGRSPNRQVRKLAKQANVIVTGTVPDVRPYLEQASIAVAPFRLARGVQNKVLEAMAMGLPVVGTPETFKGIAAREADGIRIANDPEKFARHVINLLRDGAQRADAGRQARSYVERYHRWDEQGAKLENILQEVVRRRDASSGKCAALP
jgi:sugar transferase (PEP-CTERM/EpsH1 system associated)